MTLDDVMCWAQTQVPLRRQAHVNGTVRVMRNLATRWGFSQKEGETAAWLHDLCRDWSSERLLEFAGDHGLAVGPLEKVFPLLLHGPVAALRYQEQVGLTNSVKEVFDAVFYHTTGRPNMGVLEASLFLADAIEPGREYPEVEELRIMSQTNLQRAVQRALEQTMHYLLDRGLPIHPLTVEAYNQIHIDTQMRRHS